MELEDAITIVSSWNKFGRAGLGELYVLDIDEAAQKLLDAATQEAVHEEVAFLGAMLRIRMGEELDAHVKRILERLKKVSDPGVNLRDAFAYVVAPHARNFLFLSKIVLATVLGCNFNELRREVITPLGEEAAVQILEPEYDFDEMFELVRPGLP